MHLVFLNQYYPPDAAPTGVMLEGLVQGLVDAGHEVTVLCATGGYAESMRGQPEIVDCRLKINKEGERRQSAPASPTSTSDPPSSIHIHRIRASRFGRGTFIGKLLDYVSYYFGTGWKLLTLRPRPDRIVALTTPPYLAVLARLMSKLRGADHAHWVMDLYPDVMAAHGMLARTGPVYRILAWFTRFGFSGKRCAVVMTLGPDMAERVEKHTVMPVQWVPLWSENEMVSGQSSVDDEKMGSEIGDRGLTTMDGKSDEPCPCPSSSIQNPQSAIDNPQKTEAPIHRNTETQAPKTALALELRRQRGWGDDELVVMYSGNMGLGHRFDEILAAAKELATSSIDDPQSTIPPLRFVFYGGGKRREEVAEFIKENPGHAVELHDYCPAEHLTTHLQSADVHLASLDAAWTGTMVPSKVQGIFGAARPVIFIGSNDSSIGRWVLESGGGWQQQPGDANGLLDALAEARNPAVRLTRGRAAKSFAETHFNKATNVARLTELLGSPRQPAR